MDKLKALNKKTVIAIIAICILAIIAIVGVVAFLKDDGSATAIDEVAQQENESKNATKSENVEEPSNTTENNSTVQENTSAENTNNTTPSESTNPTTNATNQPSPSVAPTTSTTGTTISTTNTNVPNQEYVTSRVEEVERQISEDLAVSWQNLNVAGKFADVKILNSNVTAEKFSSEEENTVIAGDEIVYSIEVKNIDKEAKKEIKVSDVVPEQTELIGVGELFEGDTVEIKEKDGITKIFWSINFEENEEAKILSFKVIVKENAQGTIRNVAVVDGNKTNETQNTIININKTSEIIKCDRNEKTGTTVHENDEIQYILTIQNTGDIAEKINVMDQIKEGLEYKTDSLNVSIANAQVKVEEGTIILEDYELEAGATLEISFVAIVKPLGTYIENDKINPITQATIEANDLIVNSKEITDKTPEGEDKNYEVVKPYIETKKTSSVKECSYGMIGEKISTVHEGDIIQYTITVSNEKGSESEIINLSDTIPAGLNIIGSVIVNLTDAQPQVNGNTITLNNYKLNAGSILEITFNTVVADLGTKKGANGKEEKITSATILANEVNVNTIPTKDPDGPKEVKKPNIEIAKTSTVAIAEQEYVRVGETFEYIIVATNKGTEKGSAVITDSVPSEFTINANNITIDGKNAGENIVVNGNDVTWNLNDLEVGKSKILKISVTAKDITGTKKETTNTAIINNGNPSASTDVTIGKSDIYVSKTSQVVTCNDYEMTGSNIDVVHENDEIQYTITVENKGVVSDKINVNDQLKSQVELVNGSLTAKVGENDISGVKTENGIISLDDYELAAGSKLTITFKVKVRPLGVDENGEKITNATFEANEVKVNNKPTTDPDGPEKIKKADLNITKTSSIAEGSYAEIGKQYSYYIVVENKGDESGSAAIKDVIPSNLKIESYSNALTGDTINVEGNKITWSVNNLLAKTSRRIEIKVTPISITGNEETITNTATIDNGNPPSSTDITVAKSIISSTKVSKVVKCEKYQMIDGENVNKVKTVHEGDEIEYTITITNSGKVAGIVNMSDTLPTGMTYKANSLNSAASTAGVTVANDNKSISLNNYSLAANTTLTITFRVTIDNLGTTTVNGKEVPVTSATLTANKVTVNGEEKTDPNPPTDVKKAIITAKKETEAANVEYISENRAVEYTITVTNSGTEKGNAVVTDALDDRLEYKQSVLVNKYEKDTISYDSVSNTITWNVVDLPAGESRTATITVWVGQIAQGVSETIPNEVKVDGKTTDDETITVGKPSIKTEKTSEILECSKGQKNNTIIVHEGDIIKYSIKIRNEGTLPENINVTDSIKDGLTYVEGTLNVNKENTGATITENVLAISAYELSAGQEIIITFNVKVDELTEADYSKDQNGNTIYSKKIDANVVLVNDKTTSDNKEYEVVKPMINVEKEVSKTLVSINEEFYYNIKVTNIGTDVGNAVIKDTIPNELIYNGYVLPTDIKDVVTYDETTRLLTWNVASLNVGESRELRINVKAPTDITVNPTSVVNKVYKDNNTTPEDSVETEVAKPVINTTKTSEVTVCKLNLNTGDTIGANAKTVHEGDIIKYTITIANTGKVAGIVNMNDPLPAGMTYKANSLNSAAITAGVTVANDNKSISLNNYSLAAGATLTITFEVTIDNLGTTTVDGKEVPVTSATLNANTVTVNGERKTDPNPPTTVKKPNIIITKTSNTNGKYLNVNDEFEYTITATNTGTEIGSAIVTDNLPNSVEYISYTDNGDVVDTSNLPTIKWTVKDLEIGKSRDLKIKVKAKDFTGTEQTIENKATIDNGNPDAKVTDKVGKSQISANKTSKVVVCDQYGMIDSEGKAKVTTVHEGDEIEYTITINNSGKVAGIVNMSDPLPTGMTYKANSLNSAASTAGVTVANDNKSISLNNYSLAANTTLTITFRVTIDNLGTTTVNGKEVPVTSATLTANKVTVNGEEKTDPNPPTDVKKPNINTTKTSVISECSKNQTTGTTVHEGDKIKYTITVSNDGTEYKNINVSDTLKSGVSLIENTINAKDNGSDTQGINVSEDRRTISMNGYRLEAGHTLTITFEVCVDTLNGVTKATIEANQVIVDGKTTSDKTYEVVKPNINVKKQVLNAEGTDIDGETVDVRSTLKYVLVGTNTGDEDSNVTITDTVDIANLTDINVAGIVRTNETDTKTTVTYDKQTGTVSWSGLLEKNRGNQIIITIEAKTRNLNESEVTYTVENTAKYIPEGSSTPKDTNTVTNDVKIMIEANKTANVINTENDGKAEYGDIIEYTITAENKSENAGKVNVIDPLPNGVEYTETLNGKANPIVVKVNGTNVGTGSYDANTRTISYSGNVPAGATLTLTFKVKVTSTELNEDIVNKATINGVEKTATVDVVKKLNVSATAQVTKSMDLILVLDVSKSMTNNNVGRLTALKTAAKALVEKVFPDGVETDSTVTIIAYSKDAETSPTYAYTEKASAISKINGLKSIEGTDINDGLIATNNLLTGETLTNDKQVVIFLSDGAPSTPQDSTGLVATGSTNAEKYPTYQDNSLENIVASAKNVKENADMVYAIGLGTESGLSDSCAYVTECSAIASSYTYDETNSKVIITLSNSSSKAVTVTKLTANISGISDVNSTDVTYTSGTLTWNNAGMVVSANGTLQLEVNVTKRRNANVQVSNIIPEYEIECSNITHQAMNKVVPFDGVKTSNDGKKYHYYTEKSLAKYVLKTIGKTKYIPISDGADTSGTTENISKEFDAILKESSTVNSVVSTSTSPAILEIPEEANILGNVKLTIGEKEYTYNITDLTNKTITLDTGDKLTYISSESFKGFKLTINNLETYKKELHLQYTVDKK